MPRLLSERKQQKRSRRAPHPVRFMRARAYSRRLLPVTMTLMLSPPVGLVTGRRIMKFRMFGLIALSGAALAACNSRTADEPTATNEVVQLPAQSNGAIANVEGPMQPAPEGLPSRIAREVISASGQTCASVVNADRAQDGTITASCTGGENYRVYTSPSGGAVATPM